MINIGALKELPGFPGNIRLSGASDLTMLALRNAIDSKLREYGIPYEINPEQVQSGGMFNKQYEECLTIANPLHRGDYFNYCIRLQKQGNFAFIQINYFGESKLTGQKNQHDARMNSGSLAKMALGAIMKNNQQAYDEEYRYYDLVEDALRELFGV